MSDELFQPYENKEISLSNRLVMAPLTRNRAEPSGEISPLMIKYYEQRATAGLIITESTTISPQAIGYPMTPGIYTEEHASAWSRLIEAVHNKGSKIFVQLQHCGRISHPHLQPDNDQPVSASAIKPAGQAVTYSGMQDFHTPRALSTEEIPEIVSQFENAAVMAKKAGFDGIEVHAANGYIIDQFLRDGTNHRKDQYGGSVSNRMRFLNEVLDTVCKVWPSQKVGVRISPENSFNDMKDSNPKDHFEYFVARLNSRDLAYLHVLEGDMTGENSQIDYKTLLSGFENTCIVNNGYNLEKGNQAIRDGKADLVAFGVPFLANPDLVRRYKEKLPLNEADRATFYTGGAQGYIDYPFYNE